MMDWVSFVSQVGFPIAVSSYLLFRFSSVIEKHTIAIVALSDKIQSLIPK